MSEAELIQRAKSGNTRCFEHLVFRYRDRVFKFLQLRCQNFHDAEDCLQNTFVSAFKYLHTYNDQWKFSTWLFSIAIRQLYSVDIKNYNEHYDTVTDEQALNSHQQESENDSDNIWYTIKQELESEAFDTLWFYYVEDRSTKEIALIVGRSTAWVKSSLFRSRKKLEKLLHPEPDSCAQPTRMTG